MEVYMDLAILLNFSVDFLLLYGADSLLGAASKKWRMLLAAALGAAYGGLCLLPQGRHLSDGIWPFAVLMLISIMAYGTNVDALRRGILFLLLSMALGGFAAGTGEQSLWSLILAGASIWLLCLLGFGKNGKGGSCIMVSITYMGKLLHLTALVDTGNGLKDPLTGRSVLVVDAHAGEKLLNISAEELAHPLETLTMGRYPGLRLIPYSAIGQPAGMLLAIKPDRIIVGGKQVDALVAFAPQRIGQGKPFEALVGGIV